MLALIEAAIARGQRSGAVRPGDPATLARAVLLIAQSFLISGSTMLAPHARDNPAPPSPRTTWTPNSPRSWRGT